MLKSKLAGAAAVFGLSAATFFLTGLLAEAADLPSRQAPSMLTPAPAFSWTGFYAGINGGGAWGNQDPLGALTSRFDSASFSTSGGVFGGTLGAQIQQGHVVLGVEGDLDWASITGSKTFAPTIGGVAQPFTVTARANIDWATTARMRFGFAQENWLFYGTAGVAMLGAQPHLTVLNGLSCSSPGVSIPNCSSSPLKGGLAAGLGVEYAFSPAWSAKLEWLYIAQLQGANTENANLIRVGLNYRFGG
jgi:outer membrane immunogenic protein